MARQRVITLNAEKTISLGKGKNKKGVQLVPHAEGYYLGSKQVPSQKSKTGFQTVHYLSTPAGNLGVWGFYDLNEKLAVIPKGMMVYLDYDKKSTLPNGNDMHLVDVDRDPDLMMDVGGTALAFDTSKEPEGESEATGASEPPTPDAGAAAEGAQDTDDTPDESEEDAPEETTTAPSKPKGTAPTADALKAQQERARAQLNKARPAKTA